MIQLTRHGVAVTGTTADLDSLRKKYEADNYLILPKLFEPSLFEDILQRVERAQFRPRSHEEIALELCMEDDITTAMLEFFPNNPAFLRIIEQITGQPHVGRFIGRVYKMTASDGHFDHWHDDCTEDRVITMSVNLSRSPFSGGALQLRHRGTTEILREVRNTGFGDALLFRIAENLRHRVQDVEGDAPKTAFAGWFLQREDFLPKLREMAMGGAHRQEKAGAEASIPRGNV